MLDPALLQQAMDAASEGIVIAEQEGDDNILIYANAAFTALTGYPLDEVLYQDCRFLQADDREQTALDTIRAAIKSGQPARVVLRNYRKDGRLFWNELSIRPWIHPEDGRTYFIGIQRDVTELVALRAQLAAIRETPSP